MKSPSLHLIQLLLVIIMTIPSAIGQTYSPTHLHNIEVVVHRGANYLAPENTIASAFAALKHGATWIEVDVRQSKDGILYNLHDATLDRTTNGKGEISKLNSAEIDKLDAGSWFRSEFTGLHVPRIADMLDMLQGKASVFFDVKPGVSVKNLIELVRKKGFDKRSFFWFADPDMLNTFVQLVPDWKVKVNASDINSLKKWMKICKPAVVEVQIKNITPKFSTFCTKHHIRIMAAIQNASETDYLEAIRLQPDLVNLDKPELFKTLFKKQKYSLLDYVNTMTGTAPSVTHTAGLFGKHTEEYGQTLPAVLEPNGMNFWTPQTQDTERKCIAPYYYKDNRIQGFRNSHWIVGGCTQDYGSMTLMPISGNLKWKPEERASHFTHQTEISTPAYYSVFLADYHIQAEMTGRSRSAIFRFNYAKDTDDAWLIIQPNSDENEGYLEIDLNKRQIRGYNPVHRIYQGWGEPAGFAGYFVIQLENDITGYGVFSDSIRHDGKLAIGKLNTSFYPNTNITDKTLTIGSTEQIGAYIRVRLNKQQMRLKVGTSFTGIDGALRNLEHEIPHWDFDRTRNELTQIWQQQLAKIEVSQRDTLQLRKFYSAVYRTAFLPHTLNDVDGSYPSFATGRPIKKTAAGRNYYDDFSMWDTFRALHPLLTITSPTKEADMMQSLVDKYTEGGWLPIFPCWNSYTAAMIGDHCSSVLADAYVKGIRNFDIQKAYEGMRRNAFESPATFADYKNGMGRRALDSYLKYGYIPLEDSVKEAFHQNEQVSRTLEYAYDDFSVAQVARLLGKSTDYQLLKQRSTNYKNVINPVTGYAQGKFADGHFLTTASPFTFQPFITEGAPCHYTWFIPHDIYGLVQQMGGKQSFTLKLDSMFSQKRYWHGNEPCHQIPYLFNYIGQPWKTQRAVRHIMDTEYLDAPGGLSGNDDAGQMSAWYVFSAIGFYPVCPGSPYYIIGSPSMQETCIRLEDGKTFRIIAPNASERNIYVRSVLLNGKKYTKNYISHADIIKGGVMEFDMSDAPSTEWGSASTSCPPDLMKQ